MHHAAKAYGAIAQKTASPREREADLLLDAAARLQAIRDDWQAKQFELNAALLNNRILWSIIMSAVTNPDNPLPLPLRQNVANLGLFVLKQTLTILISPQPESLGSLVRINRELAAGLLGRG